jgi:hypothetical protein
VAKRQLWDLVFHQKMGWRAELAGGIFSVGQNLHVPIVRRIVQQMIAKAQGHFFGSEPWCSSSPQGITDIDEISLCNQFVQHKLDEAGLKAVEMKAVELAGIRGECVLKTKHNVVQQSYETFGEIMVDEAGEPVIAQDGDHIYKDDLFVLDPAGQMVLRRDGVTVQPQQVLWDVQKVRRQIVTKSGPECEILEPRDFLAPLATPSLQEADTVVHFYDIPAIDLVREFISRLRRNGQWDADAYPRTMAYLRMASAARPNAQAAAGSAKAQLGELGQTIGTRSEPTIRVAEVHRWFDATQSGNRDNIYMLLDMDTKQPLLYDHVANVYDGGKRPFTPIVWWPIEGRWNGIGAVEVFWKIQEFVDISAARWELSLSQSGGVTFFSPELTQEGMNNRNLVLNYGAFYRKRDPMMPASQIVERVQLADFKGGDLYQIIQFFLQLATNMSGVSNANDAAAAGLNTGELATGVRNIKESGDEMFAPILVNLEKGVREVTEDVQACSIEYLDPEEARAVVGERGLAVLQKLKSADSRSYRWAVTLEVSSNKGERDVAQTAAATQVALEYFQLMPELQVRLYKLYRQRLKAHGVRNVDEIITEPAQQQVDESNT